MTPKRDFEIRVVLVRTIYERNVGATSRAMSNMGVDQMIMIDPKCELTYDAQQAAASGQSAMQNRITYGSWEEFLKKEPESIKVAFTARDGKGRQVQDLEIVLDDLAENAPLLKHPSDSPAVIHFIFGPEDWGLAGEDLEHVNLCACLPTFGENWSLNLAQAVLLALYHLRLKWGGKRTHLNGGKQRRAPQGIDGINPEKSLYIWLEEMGFDLVRQRKINVFTVLRRMLLQNTPTKKELVILETVLQQSIRKLREWKQFQNERKGSNH